MVNVEIIESGIVVYHWEEKMTMAEGKAALERLRPTLTGAPYVSIIDMSKTKQLPRDLGIMISLIKDELSLGLVGYVIYAAPLHAQTVGRHLSVLAPTRYYWTQDWDSALQQARAWLTGSAQNE